MRGSTRLSWRGSSASGRGAAHAPPYSSNGPDRARQIRKEHKQVLECAAEWSPDKDWRTRIRRRRHGARIRGRHDGARLRMALGNDDRRACGRRPGDRSPARHSTCRGASTHGSSYRLTAGGATPPLPVRSCQACQGPPSQPRLHSRCAWHGCWRRKCHRPPPIPS